MPVIRILFRLVDRTCFLGMTGQGAPGGGGGGAKHIPIKSAVGDTFFGEGEDWERDVIAIGTDHHAPITAHSNKDRRGGEWIIQRQHRDRHPAWSEEAGFPTADDLEALPRTILWIAETTEGQTYAGFLNAEREATLPPQLHEVLPTADNTSTAIVLTGPTSDLMPLADNILHAMSVKPCVLVYGPPGTGKTLAMQQLRHFLEDPAAFAAIELDADDADRPFLQAGAAHAFPGTVRVWWTTFHQGTTYEDFVMGLRPQPEEGGGIRLEPRAGVLLDAMEHARGNNTAVIFIDEINRGNVSRILGDFITFMEWDKRLAADGTADPIRTIPVTFPLLDREGMTDQSAPVDFAEGASRPLPWPYRVPYHVYLIGGMNSLDRSVAPLDTALARRFRRVEARVDYEALRRRLRAQPNEGHANLAVALLAAVNARLRLDLGEDYQLGPAYFWNSGAADEMAALRALADAWDEEVLPQLRELYRGRASELAEFLRADEALPNWPYHGGVDGGGVVFGEAPLLRTLQADQLALCLRGLARLAPAPAAPELPAAPSAA